MERKEVGNIITALSPKGGTILDIGCGPGLLLSYLDPQKWDRYGIEPSDKAAEIAEKKGIQILSKFVNEIDLPNYFDVIILTDVVEHLINANGTIKKAYELLKKNGILLIETGNIASLNARISGANWSYFCTYEHISFFSTSSLKFLLRKYNFQIIKSSHKSHQKGFSINTYRFLKNIAMKVIFGLFYKDKTYSTFLAYDHMLIVGKK